MDNSTRNDVFVGRDFIFDRGFSAGPVYVTDLDRCTPADAMSHVPRHRRWRLIDSSYG